MFCALHLRRFAFRVSSKAVTFVHDSNTSNANMSFASLSTSKSVTGIGARFPLSSRLWLRHRVLHKHPPSLRIFFVTGTFNTSSLRPNSHSLQADSLPTSHTILQAQDNTHQITNNYSHRHNDKGNDQDGPKEEDAGGIEGGEKRLQVRELRFVCSSPRT